MKKLVIVNIDNIIFSSFQKKNQQKELLSNYHEAIENKLFREFLSLPCDSAVIFGIKSVLTELKESADIIYLTVCPSKVLPDINCFLMKNGFTEMGGRIRAILGEQSSISDSQLYEKKKHTLCHLTNDRQVSLMLGADATDAAAAYVNKIPSIIYTPAEEETLIEKIAKLTEEDKIDEYSVAAVKRWTDVCLYAKHCLELTDSINEICNNHAANYADWLSDLDQKSYLILVVATFCATTFLSILIQTAPANRLLMVIMSALGLLASLSSMYFAIISFASRVTHGTEVIVDFLFPALVHKKKRHYAAPFEDRTQIDTSSFGASAGAKYLLKRYKTLNKNEIVAKNMMNLRASNYKKIFPEYIARVLLFCSLIIMFLIGAISCVSYFSLIPTVADVPRMEYSIKSASKDGIDDKIVSVFYSDDFDETLSELSGQGQSKIDTILNQMSEEQNLVFVSLDRASFDLANDAISNFKRNIYLTIISEALVKHGQEMEIVLIDESCG